MHLLAMIGIEKKDFIKGSMVKPGNFGNIHKGSFDGSPIAIKVFNLKSLPKHMETEFDSYYELRHPSLVVFYGLHLEPGKFSMLTEMMPESMHSFLAKSGSVVDYNTGFLYDHDTILLFNPIEKVWVDPNTQNKFRSKDQFYEIDPATKKRVVIENFRKEDAARYFPKAKFDWIAIFDCGEQIAGGLSFLHRKKIGHKHLKSNNIFIIESLTGSLKVKIGDWGLSKIRLETPQNNAPGKEPTVRWRAPETFTREFARVKDTFEAQSRADIHSFALLLWELPKKGLIPFHDKTESEVVGLLVKNTKENIDPHWPIFFQWLIEDCWNDIPTLRPSAEEAALRLRNMKDGPFHLFALKERGLPKDVFQYLLWLIHVPDHQAQILKEIGYLDGIEKRSDQQNMRLDYLRGELEKLHRN